MTHPDSSEILIYQTADGQTSIQLVFQGETLWLTQAQMAALFQKTVPTINEHIRHIYEDGELAPETTIRNFRIVQTEGKRTVSRECMTVTRQICFHDPSLRGAKRRGNPGNGMIELFDEHGLLHMRSQ